MVVKTPDLQEAETTENEVVINADTVKFDFSRFKWRDLRDFNVAMKAGDMDTVAKVLTKTVVKFPTGDPKDAETYLDLNYPKDATQIAKLMGDAMNADTKN
jgi:hypothetical protein